MIEFRDNHILCAMAYTLTLPDGLGVVQVGNALELCSNAKPGGADVTT